MHAIFHMHQISVIVYVHAIAHIMEKTMLILEVLKAPFMVLNSSCYRLMNFLMMLSIILLSVLMILHSTLCVTSHLICSNN